MCVVSSGHSSSLSLLSEAETKEDRKSMASPLRSEAARASGNYPVEASRNRMKSIQRSI